MSGVRDHPGMPNRRLRPIGAAVLAAAASIALVATPTAGAATITPNILTDEDTANGDCALREAVTAANTDGDHNGCVAVGSSVNEDADTIVLQSGETYSLSLVNSGEEDANLNGDLDVLNESLTIESSGTGLATIDGNGSVTQDRVLQLGDPPSSGLPAMTVRRIEITDGAAGSPYSGGGIFVQSVGTTTIDRSAITDSDAGAAGGIRVDGQTTITDSTISGNSASDGIGGIWSEISVTTIERSTVSGNTSAGSMGGVRVGPAGTATLVNSTVSGNFAAESGAGIYSEGTLNLRNSTVAFNTADSDAGGNAGDGGGIYRSSGTTSVRNSIIADNLDLTGAAPLHPDCSGTIVSEGHNLIENATGCSVTGDTTGNLLGGDPMLVILGFNGGPTATHRFPSGAPGENAGNPAAAGGGGTACEATDQRGLPRDVTTGACDIGAYERQPPVLDPVGDKTVQAGQKLSFGIGAVDPDPGESLSFSGTNLPAGAAVSPGEFTWTPNEGQVGAHPSVTIRVSDGSLSDSEAITITVTPIPKPPADGPDPPAQPKKKQKKCKKKKKGKKRSAGSAAKKKKKKCKKKKGKKKRG
jgi:CSLREA domain-containing protein